MGLITDISNLFLVSNSSTIWNWEETERYLLRLIQSKWTFLRFLEVLEDISHLIPRASSVHWSRNWRSLSGEMSSRTSSKKRFSSWNWEVKKPLGQVLEDLPEPQASPPAFMYHLEIKLRFFDLLGVGLFASLLGVWLNLKRVQLPSYSTKLYRDW